MMHLAAINPPAPQALKAMRQAERRSASMTGRRRSGGSPRSHGLNSRSPAENFLENPRAVFHYSVIRGDSTAWSAIDHCDWLRANDNKRPSKSRAPRPCAKIARTDLIMYSPRRAGDTTAPMQESSMA